MTSQIKAIETRYKGYRFRSRLEARWAVFFDAFDIKFTYEPEGFRLRQRSYLPDFWLPDFKCYIEIKPDDPKPDEITACQELALGSERQVVLLCGQPWPMDYQCVVVMPYLSYASEPRTALTYWGDGSLGSRSSSLWNRAGWWQCPVCGTLGIEPQYSMPQLFQCMTCDCSERDKWLDIGVALGFKWHKGLWDLDESPRGIDPARSAALLVAYTAARSARFEHGERG